MLRFDLAPGDRAVLVGVEPDREIEIAQRDVPLTLDRVAVDLECEIAVGGFMGERRRPCSSRARGTTRMRAVRSSLASRSLRAFTSAATAVYSSPVCASQRRTVSRASASPVATAASARMRRVRRLALDDPVLLREAQRELRIAFEMQAEARFLAPMNAVAACTACVEARAQRRDRGFRVRPPQRFLREREPQQQRIDSRLLF